MFKYNFNRLWAHVRRTALGRYVEHEKDLPLAMDLLDARVLEGPTILRIAGATYGNESRRWLDPVSYTAASCASTGDKDVFPVMDFQTITMIGYTFTTAGTTTALKIGFDLRVIQGSDTGRVANLDGTNGFLTAPNATTAMAIGAVITKDIGATGPIDINPGDEVVSTVITACTAGVGRSFVLTIPRAKMMADGIGTFASL